MKKTTVLNILCTLLLATTNFAAAHQKFQPIHVKNGVFYYADGREVALFGTNYYPMSWNQYVNMKAQGVTDFREIIRKDVTDMKACGVQIVRVHYFDRETSDIKGNLIKNDHLDIFDMLVAELDRQGVYLFMTPLAWWSSPTQLPDAFSCHVSKMGMMYYEPAMQASENFIKQLLTHTNPYTKRQLKDEPCLAFYEIINEPWYWTYDSVTNPDYDGGWRKGQTTQEDKDRDLKLWRTLWDEYCSENNLKKSRETYTGFQCEKMSLFLKRMIVAIRQSGAQQPIASSRFDSQENPGVLKAIGQSDVDAVIDGWYPGGFDTLHEFVNQMPEEAQAFELPKEIRGKAKAIYEWDICRTYNNVAMYPAMARRWRSMGAQIACQFQYDSAATAQLNNDWGAHFFNYEATPAKAVAFYAASKAFAQIPRGMQYPKPTDNEVFSRTAVSFEHQQVLRVTKNDVNYAHSITDWSPLRLPDSPQRIMGRGNSPYIEYTGSGLYTVEQIEPGKIHLTTTRNTSYAKPITKEFFDGISGKKVVTLNNSPERFTLKLEGWEKFKCLDENNKELAVEANTFTLTPGNSYTLVSQTAL